MTPRFKNISSWSFQPLKQKDKQDFEITNRNKNLQ